MRQIIQLLLLMVWITAAHAQSKDSLLNQRSIDRPLTLFAGQLRAAAGYELGITTKTFGGDGKRADLRQQGISYATHSFPIDIRYGISNNFQAGVRTYYRSQTQRDQMLLSISSDSYEVYQVNKKTGLEDLLLTLTGRVPLNTNKIDIVGGIGVFLPIQNNESRQPEHEITSTRTSGSTHSTVQYNYNDRWSSGVMSAFAEGAVKYRGSRSAITLYASYQHAIEEGQQVTWSHFVNNNTFSYRKEPFAFLPADVLRWNTEFEKQVMPWCVVSILVAGHHASGGWREVGAAHVSNLQQSQFSVNPGYEILVTQKLWLRQRLFFPVAGKNMESTFTISTTLVYNIFPF